ncbi:MAG: tRNA 2-selenouridine(34) synthase MnmH [Andreesenia angusta]|nr:tRNA 2-selenouridine(34) synthase MnmH [Andreesenia angusta]
MKVGKNMYESISYEESLKLSGDKIYIDLRSPSEFKKFTIPNSINIPILNDEERKVVGTLYHNGEYGEAKAKGVEFVSKKLPEMFRRYLKLNDEYKYIIIFCARGGYRSSAVAGFLHSLGLRVYKINGGYKKYRQFIMKTIDQSLDQIDFITIYGNTGTGKTKVLNHIKELGYDILDLERYANHMGSFLGSVGKGEPNSQKTFESLLAEDIINRKGKIFFLEGESKKIGKAVIPDKIYNKMINSRKIKLNSDIDFRIKNILEDYVVEDDDELKIAIKKLKRYISSKKVDEYINLIDRKEYEEVIKDLCLNYYDPMYENRERKFIKEYENYDNYKMAETIISDFIRD